MQITPDVSQHLSGVGIGLRNQHIAEILSSKPEIPWMELLADNHLVKGGLGAVQLNAIAALYPLTLHCVGMSVASDEALDLKYLKTIKTLARQLNTVWISEHLCFTSMMGIHSHDLLPFPYNENTLKHCAQRILQIQDYLGERLLIENVSSYMAFQESDMEEAEFISLLAETADCYLLIDVNNIYVNQVNHQISGEKYIDQLPLQRIKEVHLAGYQQQEGFLLDCHNNPVSAPVWQLYERLMQRQVNIPTLIEWDNDIPALSVLLAEAEKAATIMQACR